MQAFAQVSGDHRVMGCCTLQGSAFLFMQSHWQPQFTLSLAGPAAAPGKAAAVADASKIRELPLWAGVGM